MLDQIAGYANEISGSYSNMPGVAWFIVTMLRIFVLTQS